MEQVNNALRAVIVTGGAINIGRMIVEAYLQDGYNVAIIARNKEQMARTVKEFSEKYNNRCHAYSCDIKDRDNLTKTIRQIANDLGRICILVNNAGANSRAKIGKHTDLDWDNEIETNLTGSRNCAMAVLNYMKGQGGHIINIASIKAKEPTSSIGYGASKAGVIGLTKSLAKQFIPFGIYVNCIAPGFINTGMTKLLSPEEASAYLERIPIGRMGEEKEIASVVKFLTSSASSYIVGATIDVNGGYLMD